MGQSPQAGQGGSYCVSCERQWGSGQNFCPGCGHQPPGFAIPSDQSGEMTSTEFSSDSGSAAIGRAPHRMGGVTWGGWQIIFGIVLVMLSLFSAASAALVLGSFYPEQEDAVSTWISVHLMALAIIGTVWYLGLRHCRYPLAVLRLSRVTWPRKRTVLLMFGVLGASLISTSIYSGIVEWLGVDELAIPVVESDIFFDGPAVLLTFQALAFITPMSEELFFRGFIFRGLLPKMGPWWAIAVSALLFSGFHLSVGVLIPIFITGFLLAWLYWKTGSLWAAIGAHAGQNALALAAQAFS